MKTGPVVLFPTLQCRRFGGESFPYSETNGLIHELIRLQGTSQSLLNAFIASKVVHKENRTYTRAEILSWLSLSYTSMATNADQWKWHQRHIYTVSTKAMFSCLTKLFYCDSYWPTKQRKSENILQYSSIALPACLSVCSLVCLFAFSSSTGKSPPTNSQVNVLKCTVSHMIRFSSSCQTSDQSLAKWP